MQRQEQNIAFLYMMYLPALTLTVWLKSDCVVKTLWVVFALRVVPIEANDTVLSGNCWVLWWMLDLNIFRSTRFFFSVKYCRLLLSLTLFLWEPVSGGCILPWCPVQCLFYIWTNRLIDWLMYRKRHSLRNDVITAIKKNSKNVVVWERCSVDWTNLAALRYFVWQLTVTCGEYRSVMRPSWANSRIDE